MNIMGKLINTIKKTTKPIFMVRGFVVSNSLP